MAGNKFDTGFKIESVNEVKVTYVGMYGEEMIHTGTPAQMINLLTQIMERNFQAKCQ